MGPPKTEVSPRKRKEYVLNCGIGKLWQILKDCHWCLWQVEGIADAFNKYFLSTYYVSGTRGTNTNETKHYPKEY